MVIAKRAQESPFPAHCLYFRFLTLDMYHRPETAGVMNPSFISKVFFRLAQARRPERPVAWTALLAAICLGASPTRSEPLTAVHADSPFDILLVANVNAFPKNIDGSLRLANPEGGVDISTCYLSDSSKKQFVWQATLSDRKQQKSLQPLLNVPAAYAGQGVPNFMDDVTAILRQSLQSLLQAKGNAGRAGTARFKCDEYRFERNFGAAESAVSSRMYVIPAYLIGPLITELQSFHAYSTPERFAPDQYSVIDRVPISALRNRASRLEADTAAERARAELYRSLAQASDTSHIGLIFPERVVLQPATRPVVCAVDATDSQDDAIAAYAERWSDDYRRAVEAALSARGEARAPAVADLVSTVSIVKMASLNEVFLGMSRTRSCTAFAGTPAEVVQVRDALERDFRIAMRLGELEEVVLLDGRFAAAAGFAKYSDLEFSRSIRASRDQTLSLIAQGVLDKSAYEALRAEIRAIGYSTSSEITMVLAYLNDQQAGLTRGLSATQERDRRLAESRERAAALEARRRAEQAAFDAEYPYEIIIQCGVGGRHASITPCFSGATDGGNTQLELRTADRYGMYQFFELHTVGEEVPGEGLKISVKRPFSLQAQNADARLTLTVKVRDKRTDQIVFIKSAGQYGVIATRQ
jgi:hypothetical protein